MSRSYVVTGSVSGIGRATRELLESRGHRVIGVDLRDAEIVADLATAAGRRSLVDGVAAMTGGAVDGVIACAGVAYEEPDTVRVNYFGTVATLEGLRPLLVRGTDPRAVLVSSVASILPVDSGVVESCLAGDEEAAVAAVKGGGTEGHSRSPFTVLTSPQRMPCSPRSLPRNPRSEGSDTRPCCGLGNRSAAT